MRIPIIDKVNELSQQMTFSYREVYAVNKYCGNIDLTEKYLQQMTMSAMPVSEFLMKFYGVTPAKVYELLFEPCEYYQEEIAPLDTDEIKNMLKEYMIHNG